MVSDNSAVTGSNPPPRWTMSDRRDLLVFLVVGFAPVALLQFLTNIEQGASVWKLQNELLAKGVTAFSLVLATWIVSLRTKRPLGDYGIPPREAFGLRFWQGVVLGFGVLASLLFSMNQLGHVEIQSTKLSPNAVVHYAGGWGLVFLFVALSEELAFRGYLLFVAARRIRFWPASIALSIGFAASHLPNQGETAIGILHTLGTGLLFCFFVRRTGNLWLAIGYHASWDWGESYFYGTPDSGLLAEGHLLNTSFHGASWITGGTAGPEGSIISLVLLALCALFIHLIFPKAIYPDRPGT